MTNLKLVKLNPRGSVTTALIVITALFSLTFTTDALAKSASGWRMKNTAEVETTYSTNVFNLSTGQQDGLETNNADDQTSGRYTDMEHVSDLILSPAIELDMRNSSATGNTTKIQTKFTYNQHLLNTKKSYPEVDFEVEQELGNSNSIGFEFGYKFDVFKKNYLSDAADGGVGATVTPDERIYTEGSYNAMVTDL
ncbi:MAG: hypothetical protein IME98_03280, partial [Proteobacteria bacterium]|nr:hypothetical protein [Pseudomonadota bacterium]